MSTPPPVDQSMSPPAPMGGTPPPMAGIDSTGVSNGANGGGGSNPAAHGRSAIEIAKAVSVTT